MLCLVTQLCPTLFDLMDCSLQDSSVHGHSPGKNTGVGFHALLQIFPTQGSSPGLPYSGVFLTIGATREAHHLYVESKNNSKLINKTEKQKIHRKNKLVFTNGEREEQRINNGAGE